MTRDKNNRITGDIEVDELSHSSKRNMVQVMSSAFIAGALSATIVNPLEVMVCHYQNTHEKSFMQTLKVFKDFRSLFKGVHFSVLYYGTTS